MNCNEVLTELAALGTEQNRKVYRRHGAGGDLFGVRYGNLKQLKKKIKVDHDLARALWATGNHDARILATQVADPSEMDAALLDAWAADLDNYMIADAFSIVASRTAEVQNKVVEWTRSDGEWIGQTGWLLLAHLARNDDALPDAFFEPYLHVIERGIHQARNRARAAMNSALIAIGSRNETLEEKALAVAHRIGKVEVDHGETNCKTPDAAEYIRKARARKA